MFKKIYILFLGIFPFSLSAQIYSQEKIVVQNESLLYVQGGGLHFATAGSLLNQGTVKLAGDWQNHSSAEVLQGKGKVIFADQRRQIISGSFPTRYAQLEIYSPLVEAQQMIWIDQQLNFVNGFLHFQNKGILAENASISGEKNESYATGTLETTRFISQKEENFGNMGVLLNPQKQELGNTTLIRKAGQGTEISLPFQSSIGRTWEIRSEKTPSQPVSLQLKWLSADNNSRDLEKAQVWQSDDRLQWKDVKPVQNLTNLEANLQTKNLHHFTISGKDLKGLIQYQSLIFTESGLNDGSIANSLKILLSENYDFNAKSGEDLLKSKKLEVINLPEGLQLEAIFIDAQNIEFRLLGKALAHQKLNNVNNLGIKFLTSAFQNGNPNYIAGAEQALQIAFRDQAIEETLKSYPNPTTGIVNVDLELAASSLVKVRLYHDAILIFESESLLENLLYKTQFDLSLLPAGLYILEVKTPQNTLVQKIIKVN